MNYACSVASLVRRLIFRHDHFARPVLPEKWKSFAASGKATLYSYVINHLPHPAFDGPYAIAVVELREGPRMMTNLVEVEQTPEALLLDMPLEVTFETLTEEISLPYFRPAGGAL